MNNPNTLDSEPKLRFPKFKGKRFTITLLGNVAHVIKERAGKNIYPTMSVTSGVGLLSQREKFGREIAGNQYKNYYVIKKWDFAYNKSATKLYPEGYIAMLQNAKIGAVPNSIFTCFRILKGKAAPEYLNFLFHDNFHGKWLKKFIEVGARVHGALSVGEEALMSMPMILPPVDEQQKIADCLSSLDDLITANTQKLEALKAHKKGLMQNLFPQEGETVPRLRFKEFRKCVRWCKKEFDEILEITRLAGYEYSEYWQEDPNREIIALRGYNIGKGKLELHDLAYISNSLSIQLNRSRLSKGDIVYPCVGTIGNAVVIEENDKYHIQQNIAKLTPKQGISPYFISQFLMSQLGMKEVYRFNATSSQPNVLVGSLRKFKVSIPYEAEQKKIAACLTSLDDLIAKQIEKVDLLKKHKKGLMQGMFPSLNETN